MQHINLCSDRSKSRKTIIHEQCFLKIFIKNEISLTTNFASLKLFFSLCSFTVRSQVHIIRVAFYTKSVHVSIQCIHKYIRFLLLAFATSLNR